MANRRSLTLFMYRIIASPTGSECDSATIKRSALRQIVLAR